MKYIGDMYYSGSGIQSNKKIAANWYQKASNAGDAESQFTLGKMLMSGDGINRDLQAGLDLIKKAAEQGHAAAQNLFGIHLLDGEGIDKNQTEAYAWFIKAAQQNNPEALNHAAQMFFIGYGNLDTALQMLNQAAEHGVSDAQLRLGLMYEHGEYVKKSIAMAIYWFRRAADRHNAIALQHLAALSINHKHHTLQSE